MNIESFMTYCKTKKAVSEEFPFDADTLVYKVAGKMFAVTSLEKEFAITLKTSEEKSIELRAAHDNVEPAWHFNKKYWITIKQPWQLSQAIVCQLIDESYVLVVDSLTKKLKTEFGL